MDWALGIAALGIGGVDVRRKRPVSMPERGGGGFSAGSGKLEARSSKLEAQFPTPNA